MDLIKGEHVVLVSGLDGGHGVGDVGCDCLGDFFHALGCNVKTVVLERFEGGVRGRVSFGDHRSVERALRVKGDWGPCDPKQRPHGRLRLSENKLHVSQIDAYDLDSNASTEASTAEQDEPMETLVSDAKTDCVKEIKSAGALEDLLQALKPAFSADAGPDAAASVMELLATGEKEVDLARLRDDAVVEYNKEAPEGWLVPVVALHGPEQAADLSPRGLPPLAPPAEPPQEQPAVPSWADRVRTGDSCQPAQTRTKAAARVIRKPGCIKSLVREKGFGFISSGRSSEDLFFHVGDNPDFSMEAAKVGDKILFSIATDGMGRRKAVSVSLRCAATEQKDRTTPPAQPMTREPARSELGHSGRRAVLSLPTADPAASEVAVPAASTVVLPSARKAADLAASQPAAAAASVPSWADRMRAGGPCEPPQARRIAAPAQHVPLKKGHIKSLVSDKGFGFISTGKSSEDVFFHVKDNPEFSFQAAKVNDKILYSIRTDGEGRRRAVSVCMR